MACGQEGCGECARGERKHGQAIYEAISGFSGKQERGDDLRFAKSTNSVGTTPGDETLLCLRSHFFHMSPNVQSHLGSLVGNSGFRYIAINVSVLALSSLIVLPDMWLQLTYTAAPSRGI